MKRTLWAAACGVLVFAVSACGSSAEEAAAPEANAATSAAPAEEATPTTVETAAPESGLPTRAEMDSATRTLAEAYFLNAARDGTGLDTQSDDTLLSAGDAACDSMDRGDSLRSVLIIAAALVPDAPSTDSIALLVGSATVLCPEHAEYAG